MIPTPTISEHALLRYMERIHGIDMPLWRSLMQSDLDASLAAYQGRHSRGQPAFVLSSTGRVLTVLNERCRCTIPPNRPTIAVPLIVV